MKHPRQQARIRVMLRHDPDWQVFEAAMHLFFSKPTRELAAVAEESLNRLAGAPLKIGVQMRMGGGEWADPTRYQGVPTPHRVSMLLWARDKARPCSGPFQPQCA